MKTFSPTPKDINRQWFVVDAQDQVLGRLASQIAHRLRGKHKPEFAPHMDNGDFIVVVNCEKIKVTGNKLQDKKYYRHSGWVGGLKTACSATCWPSTLTGRSCPPCAACCPKTGWVAPC